MIPNPWIILAFVLALLGVWEGGLYTGKKAGRAEIQQAWDKEKAAQYADFAKRQEEARKREQELQANADQLRREKDAEIRNINARATGLLASMQQRAPRGADGSGVSKTAGAGPNASRCTGAELSREDAEFLAREAARADELRTALKQCTQQYGAVAGR